MTKPEARKLAKQLIANGHHDVCIVENVSYGTVVVKSHNRCWTARTYETLAQGLEDIRK